MNQQEYEKTRASLVKERKRLMDVLESQGDFPRGADIIAYEVNKRTLIDLDVRWENRNRTSSMFSTTVANDETREQK